MRAKIERNKELVLKRLSDPKKWSFGKLGDHYCIGKTVAEEIFKRDEAKYQKEQLSTAKFARS